MSSPHPAPIKEDVARHAKGLPRRRMKLYARLDSAFDDSDEDPRASLVNLVDVMLVFACGLMAALAAGGRANLMPQPVEKGREIERPAVAVGVLGSGYSRVGEVFRDPKTGKLILIEPDNAKANATPQIAAERD